MNTSQEDKYRQQNMDKLRGRGKEQVKKDMLTAFISSGNLKGINKEDIARSANINYNDRKMMSHIENQLKRRDARERK